MFAFPGSGMSMHALRVHAPLGGVLQPLGRFDLARDQRREALEPRRGDPARITVSAINGTESSPSDACPIRPGI